VGDDGPGLYRPLSIIVVMPFRWQEGGTVDNIVKRVLLNSDASKSSKIARGESLTQPIRLVDRKPPADPLADFYGKIRDTAKLTDGITLAERIAVLDVVRAELVASSQAQIDDAEADEA